MEQRRESAEAALRARLPASVQCNNCQAVLADLQPMDTRGLDGLRLAAAAICPSCKHTTWVVDGEPAAIERFHGLMAEQHGHDQLKLGVAGRPA